MWSSPSRYEEAEQDCGAALSLDSTYSKAFARRGTARLALGRLREAQQGTFCFRGSIVFIFNEATVLNALLCLVCFHLADFQELLKLEPGNKQALNELQKIKIVRRNYLFNEKVYD